LGVPAAVTAARSHAAAPEARALLGRRLDPLVLGGFSLAVPLGVAALLGGPLPRALLARVEHYAAIFLVLPHFLSSYLLLYWDYRRRLTEPRFAAVALGAPVALLALFAQLYLSSAPPVPLWLVVQAMFFLSGWHYLKQSYGCALAGCALAGAPLSQSERRALRANLWSVGALAYLVPNCAPRAFSFAGLPYASLALPKALAWLAAAAFAGTAGLLLSLLRRRARRLPASAVASVLGFYAWTLPILVSPDLFYTFRFVPLAAALHSLQYLAFVGPLRWRRVERAGVTPARAGVFAGGWLLMAFSAPWLFYRLPGLLDRSLAYDHARLGPIFFVGAVHLFVNIHHYFIDAVIWKKDNPELAGLLAGARG
jgi:hypothetical protein